MPGRIRDDDIAEVRERARIEDVIGEYVTLRNAGGGSVKGLCPFHDEKSPSFNVTPSRRFFHCLAGETRVLTYEGSRPIADLAGGTHRLLGASARWVEAPVRSYGVQALHRIVVTRNGQRKELYATDGHRWFVRDGAGGRGTREVLTTSLEAGDRLAATYPVRLVTRTTPSASGVVHGFAYGDGTRSGSGPMALVRPLEDAAVSEYPHNHATASGSDLLVRHLPGSFESRPPREESVAYLYGWLAGYFAADGCVAQDGTVVLNSSDRSDLEFVRDLCTRLGIGTFGVTSQLREGSPGREASARYRVHVVNEDLTPEFFVLPQHRERFRAAATSYVRRGWVVRSVEPTDRVEEVFCAEVEDGHAFTLEDNILTGNCFGCAESGDVFDFLQKIDGLTFTESVERLADRVGVQLRRVDGDDRDDQRPKGPPRQRLIEANRVAQEFYAEHLAHADAVAGRRFLSERGFDQTAAETFGIGFAPREGDALFKHLRGRGFSQDELVTAGLVAVGRSAYDRFRGRLLWPIRESSGATIGFGARRIFDDDRIEAKYLNTSETPIYKKSQVLYGIDLARRAIASSSQAVVVEGYTDVMACHLAGVPTAVASCGTAFGEEHTRVLRRFLHDHEEFRGEVVFTFDGDAAGQKAALKAFALDEKFVSQTYVAVQPDGLDPCDLRIRDGDAAVRDLVARRRPLYRFVLDNVVAQFDLDRADGRVDALREGAKLVSSVRDKSKVDAFARELAMMVGADVDEARTEVRRSAGRSSSAPASRTADAPRGNLPDPRDPRFAIERETLKLTLQHPMAIGRTTGEVGPNDFTHPTYRGVWEVIAAAGGPVAGAGDAGWVARLRDAATTSGVDPTVAAAVGALAVEQLPTAREPDAAYVAHHVVRLLELTVLRRIAEVKARLQRTNPVEHAVEYNKMFGELAALEQRRRALRDRIAGGV